MRRTLSLLAFAVALAAPPPGHGQLVPPPVERVLEVDTVFVFGSANPWRMRYVEVDGPQNPWVEVEDPYGGHVRIPSLYYLAISSDLVAFIEGNTYRSVFFVRRSLMAPIALFLVVGLITVIGFPFAVYRRRLRRERERRRHLDEIRHQLAEGREAERLRLAQDLHDGPVQDLHALRMRLSMLNRAPTAADGPQAAVSESVAEVVEEVQRVIRNLRGVSEDLRPPALVPFGLAAALHAFAERFRQTHPSIQVDLDLDDDEQALPEQVRLVLFRIAQEAMNNAAKHGAPGRIEVVFRLDDEQVLLNVSDDGRGYVVPTDFRLLGKNGHYGLLGMSERADSIGAQLHLESHPGKGKRTQVRVTARRSTLEQNPKSKVSWS